jgi:chromate transport protein ChrA
MKPIVTVLAIVIALIGYIPYIRNCILGKTKPHIISWFTWSLVSYLAFGIQLFNEGGVGSFVNLVMGIICTIIFILGLKNGTKDIRKIDVVAFVLALIAIVLWLIAKQPLLSIILVVFIDLMSFLPTILKGWREPHTKTAVTFLLSGIKNGMSIYALESFSLINVLYPTYSALTNVLFVVMLFVRRRVDKEGK